MNKLDKIKLFFKTYSQQRSTDISDCSMSQRLCSLDHQSLRNLALALKVPVKHSHFCAKLDTCTVVIKGVSGSIPLKTTNCLCPPPTYLPPKHCTPPSFKEIQRHRSIQTNSIQSSAQRGLRTAGCTYLCPVRWATEDLTEPGKPPSPHCCPVHGLLKSPFFTGWTAPANQ